MDALGESRDSDQGDFTEGPKERPERSKIASRMKAIGLAAALAVFVAGASCALGDAVCGDGSRPDCARAVEFYHRVKTALQSDDRKTLAGMIEYPLLARLNHRKVRVADRRELVAHFDEIFDPQVRCAILNSTERDVWGNSNGFTVGNGAIWFDGIIPSSEHPNPNAPDFWTKYPFRIKTVNNESNYGCKPSSNPQK
jgi:hypothetical protein